jgi:hypothetical protein
MTRVISPTTREETIILLNSRITIKINSNSMLMAINQDLIKEVDLTIESIMKIDLMTENSMTAATDLNTGITINNSQQAIMIEESSMMTDMRETIIKVIIEDLSIKEIQKESLMPVEIMINTED